MRLRRMSGFEERVQWNLGPPRVRYDEAVLDVAAEKRDPVAAVGVLADACGSRRTTAGRLLTRLDSRNRISQRLWPRAVLADVALGTCSVLEYGYQTARYSSMGTRHEWSGRTVFSPAGSRRSTSAPEGGCTATSGSKSWARSSNSIRDRDLERELDAAVGRDATTLRLGFGQVYERSCATARKVGTVMNRHGWTGAFHPCGQCGAADEAG
jgi:hypothetical protein